MRGLERMAYRVTQSKAVWVAVGALFATALAAYLEPELVRELFEALGDVAADGRCSR